MTAPARELFRWDSGSIAPRAGRALSRTAFAVLALLVSGPAAAQENREPLTAEAEQPTVKPSTATRRLDLGMSFFDAYDMTTITDARGVFFKDPIENDRSEFAGGSAALTYTQTGRDNTFSAAGGSNMRYYSGPGVFPADAYGGFNFSTRVSKRIRLQGSETASYSPYYTFGSAPLTGSLAEVIAPRFDQAVNRVDTVSSSTIAGMSWTLDRRSSINVGYNFDYIDAGVSAYHVHTMGANGAYLRQLSRYLNIRAGYGFYRSQLYGVSVPYYDSQNIDAGVSYRRPLSFSRRSVVGFNVGSTVISDGVTRRFYVTGDASLSHQLSQFWLLTAAYNRAVSRIGGLAAPFATDTGSVSVGGRVTRYLTLSGSGSFSRGAAVAVTSNAYDSTYGGGRLSYQLTRYLPVYAEYVYYFYQFQESIGLATGFPMNVNRHGLRAGLAYAIPLIGRRTS